MDYNSEKRVLKTAYFGYKLYILASVFFLKKTKITILKLEIRVAFSEFLALKYVVIVFFSLNKSHDYLYCTLEILKTRV